ncbi:DUF4876 domain-containing protein [Sphingobacterium spiritivorum]|uniref:DUF4876 domain-containing protein n=1 Tax=Sphingobacterium spiritivorum TaxID=258 RepID=UPI003DA5C960
MKKILYLFVLLLPFAACKKETPDVATIDVDLKINYSNTDFQKTFPLKNIQITLRNLSTNVVTKYVANGGTFQIAGLAPGSYDIDASVTIPRQEYTTLAGEDPGTDITFNASNKRVSLINATSLEFNLIAGQTGSFVLKQIYYAGSDNKEGALYRDQFIEIYNNTDQVLYADSLYFGRLYGRQSTRTATTHIQANGQHDWSKSLNMTVGNAANTDYVYGRDLFMVPGTGKDYPVQPGQSIIIAQNALNHKIPFIGADGKEVPIKKPELTVDLSGANFEVYYGKLPGINPLPSDIDNPSVPNVDIIDYEARDWILDSPGRDSYFIFKGHTRQAVEALKSYYEPTLSAPSASAKTYRQIPSAWLMDAVEVQPNLPDSRIPKKLLPAFDSGYTFATDGSYSSQSVIRKTATTVSGRRVLKDTNNSTEDFTVIKANPRGFAD